MKDILVLIKITAVGFFVAAFVYPLVHEGGHMLAAVLGGGRLEGLGWYPVPHVLYEMDRGNTAMHAVTCLAGVCLPMVAVLPFAKSRGVLGFGTLTFACVVLFSTAMGVVVAGLRLLGTTVQGDDITAFIDCTGQTAPTLLLMLGLSAIAAWQVAWLKPKQSFLAMMGQTETPLAPRLSATENLR